jgi:hypothetical protein
MESDIYIYREKNHSYFYFQKMRKNFRFSLAIKPAGACQLYERQKGEKWGERERERERGKESVSVHVCVRERGGKM